MTRLRTALGGAVAAAALMLVVTPGPLASSGRTATEARSVAKEFFRTINARQYEQTCGLLSAAYFERYHIPSTKRCATGLRMGFQWSPTIHCRITGVTVEADRVVVHALANGAPGRLVLVREEGRLKIFALEGR